MPMPLSLNLEDDLVLLPRARRSLMVPPAGVYLIALSSRLSTIWRICTGLARHGREGRRAG